MKKIFTLICAAAMMCGMNAQTVQRFDVTKQAEFNEALTSIEGLAEGSTAYVYITGDVDVKTIDLTSRTTLRNIHFIGVNDEEGNQATLRMEMKLPADNTESSGFSLHYENLRLMQTQGVWGNSKHLMNFKDSEKHYIDTLEFVNCELTELCRSIYRAEAQNKEESAGTMKCFRMENCTVHNGFRQYDAMPAIYMAQPVNEMVFKNNTFYDLTYLNSIVSFGTMTDATGRQAVKVVFENNTICAFSRSTLLNFGSGVSTESEFHIKNNIVLQPNWIDDMNGRQNDNKDVHSVEGETWTDKNGNELECRSLTEEELQARIEKGIVLTGIQGGLVQLENNVLYGYKYQSNSEESEFYSIPIGNDENEEVEWSWLSMEDVPFAWTDFVDAQNDMFQINDQHPIHSAGKNGAPIGNINEYTDKVIAPVTVSISVEGSQTVSVTIDPIKTTYFSGDKITVTLNDHNNALRTINTFKGWSDGSMETTRTIELTGDLNLVANYEAAISNIVSWFDLGTTPAAGQNKLTEYKADVFAEGNQAVATLMFVPNITDEENTVIGLEENYKQADGSENRFNWRAGKFGEDPDEQKICVLSRKTSPQAQAAGKPDFLVFTFATTGLNDIEFSAFCGTDNFGYKTQMADYSIDGGATWTNFAKVDLESRAAEYSIGEGLLWGWTELKGTLPEAAENQEKVQVRIIGDVTGEKVDNVVSEIDQDNANMFEYVGAVLITTANGEDGIAEMTKAANTANAPAYNLMGIRVNAQAKGLLIQGGKKHIVK